ncbi:MAG TPA: hypothetical protein VJQ55_09465 [Candidatus Binatia bacterium]|nr:hypothetical protein [Candidatus Binatia bacterium]
MKTNNNYLNHDQNWTWPEKTWFRERLNAIKARENEERRKSLSGSSRAGQVKAPPAAKDELKVD